MDGLTTSIDPSQSTLSPNFAQYVYNMLGKGEAAANLPYQEFTGQRFAGISPLQQQAFQGLQGLAPSAGTGAGIGAAQQALTGLQGLQPYQGATFTPGYTPGQISTGLGPVGTVADYMSPYQPGVVDIQAREARRQADISRQAEQARLAQAGAYGGSRQAIMEAERQRNLGEQIGDIQAKGLQSAYDRAMQQRFQEAQLGLTAQEASERAKQFGANIGLEAQRAGEASRQFGAGFGLQGLQSQLQGASTLGALGQQQFGQGLQGLQEQLRAGEIQRKIEQEPLEFGYQQFQESMKYPFQQATFMQSLLQGLPLQARPYDTGQSGLAAALSGGLSGLALYKALFGDKG